MEEPGLIWEILRGFTNLDVSAAYQKTLNQFNVISIATGLGIAFGVVLFIKESGETALSAFGFNNGHITKTADWSKILLIFRPALILIGVVAVYPYILQYIENFLSLLAEQLGGFKNPNANLRDAWQKEAIQLREEIGKTSSWKIGQKMFLLINYSMIMFIKPFFILLEQDAFTLFLMLRYMYLIILQLFGGVAIACYISKDTRQYFYTWLKHMMFCYAMVGVFGMANYFADTALREFIGNNSAFSYNILVIAFGVVVKLFLFKQSFNLLKNSIF